MRLTAVTKEGCFYVARCLEVEMASQGEDLAAAPANLREALELHFEDVPQPVTLETPATKPVEVNP
jgi:predicted RNase H-like HicB family nuclease